MLEDMYGGTVKMRPALLEPSTKRQILARILNNLKSLYLSRGDLARALAASDRIMLTDPHLTSEWRGRGLDQFQKPQDTEGVQGLSRYHRGPQGRGAPGPAQAAVAHRNSRGR